MSLDGKLLGPFPSSWTSRYDATALNLLSNCPLPEDEDDGKVKQAFRQLHMELGFRRAPERAGRWFHRDTSKGHWVRSCAEENIGSIPIKIFPGPTSR